MKTLELGSLFPETSVKKEPPKVRIFDAPVAPEVPKISKVEPVNGSLYAGCQDVVLPPLAPNSTYDVAQAFPYNIKIKMLEILEGGEQYIQRVDIGNYSSTIIIISPVPVQIPISGVNGPVTHIYFGRDNSGAMPVSLHLRLWT